MTWQPTHRLIEHFHTHFQSVNEWNHNLIKKRENFLTNFKQHNIESIWKTLNVCNNGYDEIWMTQIQREQLRASGWIYYKSQSIWIIFSWCSLSTWGGIKFGSQIRWDSIRDGWWWWMTTGFYLFCLVISGLSHHIDLEWESQGKKSQLMWLPVFIILQALG